MPNRIRMAHNLILNYGLDREMNILRPAKATAHNMTAFHTDEYIEFLSIVSPESVADLTGNGTRCMCFFSSCPSCSMNDPDHLP